MNRIKDEALDGKASNPTPGDPALASDRDDEAARHEAAVEATVSFDSFKSGIGAAFAGARPAEERSETALSLERASREGGGTLPD